ncbi:hypothetical protein TNCV_1119541 [Trichonephila clavipes]|uniref:Uncharacterized protein n=1 Tax=Trichonephila clavipes TaxID=2585209 RepID=A0A8X6VT09_TRICX|nr:hypothetical protein TNCV_1119541 [Trichonephila clavipes]
MAYLGNGRREDLFVLATELNLEFDKSMTIATLKDLIIGSENNDEELNKNIHSTIVENRKAREKNQEEQKEKLRIEEREEKLRIEQLRTATAGSDVVQSGLPIFDDFFQHLWPYIGNNTASVGFQMVKRLWPIRIDQ